MTAVVACGGDGTTRPNRQYRAALTLAGAAVQERRVCSGATGTYAMTPRSTSPVARRSRRASSVGLRVRHVPDGDEPVLKRQHLDDQSATLVAVVKGEGVYPGVDP